MQVLTLPLLPNIFLFVILYVHRMLSWVLHFEKKSMQGVSCTGLPGVLVGQPMGTVIIALSDKIGQGLQPVHIPLGGGRDPADRSFMDERRLGTSPVTAPKF